MAKQIQVEPSIIGQGIAHAKQNVRFLRDFQHRHRCVIPVRLRRTGMTPVEMNGKSERNGVWAYGVKVSSLRHF